MAGADLVSFPKGDAKWVVDITYHSAGSATSSQPQPTHVEVAQVNGTRQTKIVWSNKETTEKWSLSAFQVVFDQRRGSKDVVAIDSEGPFETVTRFNETYEPSSFDWITSSCLQEKDPIEYGGKLCFHYLGSATPPMQKDPIPSKREAWIDATTLLPVALDTPDCTSSFTFEKAPLEGLSPPTPFKEVIDDYKSAMGVK
jgi:hypothetical protein